MSSPQEKGQNKLLDPNPQRRKFVLSKLYSFFTQEITYAQLMGVSQKELYQLTEIGYVKLIHGRVEEAKRIFESLVQVDSKNYYHHSVLGSVYQKQKRYIEAVYEYGEALRFNSSDVGSMVNRGEVYLLHKNYRKAADDFKAAISLDPSGRSNYANRARSLVIAIKRALQLQKEQKPQVAPGKPSASALPGK